MKVVELTLTLTLALTLTLTLTLAMKVVEKALLRTEPGACERAMRQL